nr:MFS transporter [Nocardioides halotolerans]
MAALLVSVASFSLLQSLIVPVLGTFQDAYDASPGTVAWVLTGYLLSASVTTPIVGRLGDIVGKTQMLIITLAILSGGSLIASVAPSIHWLIAARVLQGLGGGVLPLTYGIARDMFHLRYSGALATLASVAAGSFGIGIILAGPIVELVGFRGLFLVPMAMTTAAGIAAYLRLPRPTPAGGRLPSARSTVLLTASLISLLLALSKGVDWGWDAPRTLTAGALSVVAGVLWVRSERSASTPLVDLRLMGRRGVWSTSAIAGLVGFSTFALYGFLPQFVQGGPADGFGFGASITQSCAFLVPAAITSFIFGMAAPRLERSLGARPVIVGGCAVIATSLFWLTARHTQPWQIHTASAMFGAGSGVVIACMATVVISSVPSGQSGAAGGLNANARTLGGSAGAAAMAAIVDSSGVAGHPTSGGFTAGFAMLGVSMVLATAAACVLPTPRRGSPAVLPIA